MLQMYAKDSFGMTATTGAEEADGNYRYLDVLPAMMIDDNSKTYTVIRRPSRTPTRAS